MSQIDKEESLRVYKELAKILKGAHLPRCYLIGMLEGIKTDMILNGNMVLLDGKELEVSDRDGS